MLSQKHFSFCALTGTRGLVDELTDYPFSYYTLLYFTFFFIILYEMSTVVV